MFEPREPSTASLNSTRINAHRADGDLLIANTKSLQHVRADRLFGFGAQAFDASGRIIARERGQVNTRHRAQQPGRLAILF